MDSSLMNFFLVILKLSFASSQFRQTWISKLWPKTNLTIFLSHTLSLRPILSLSLSPPLSLSLTHTHTHIHTYTHTHMHTHIHKHTYTHSHVFTNTHTHTFTRIHKDTHTHSLSLKHTHIIYTRWTVENTIPVSSFLKVVINSLVSLSLSVANYCQIENALAYWIKSIRGLFTCTISEYNFVIS